MDISGKMLGGMPISDKLRTMVQDRIYPYRELMAYYNCAMMEVATKFNVLNEELSLQYDRNPIESIRTRLKSVDSIAEKLTRKGISLPLNVEKIQEEIHDIAGVRVICSYPSDIYMLSEAFLRQDDIFLVERKDYIQNPKPNGYRSLHLIVEVPIFLHNRKKLMKVEVQFRTIAMDYWASLEHALRYKTDLPDAKLAEHSQTLLDCARSLQNIETQMQNIHRDINSAPRVGEAPQAD